MSEHRDAKRVQRAIRKIPVDDIGPQLAIYEGNDGRFCIIGNHLEFINANGRQCETTWDSVQAALIGRYVRSRPERTHSTYESALAFVQFQVSK